MKLNAEKILLVLALVTLIYVILTEPPHCACFGERKESDHVGTTYRF